MSSFLHVFYQIFLLNAYRNGELSEVYPVARGLSPLIIISISLFFLNEDISFYEVLGIFMISLSLIIYGIKQIRNNKSNITGFYLAIATGCLIASYSIVDGHGARVTKNPVGFFSSMTLINAFIFYCFAQWKERQIIKKIFVGRKDIILCWRCGFLCSLWYRSVGMFIPANCRSFFRKRNFNSICCFSRLVVLKRKVKFL